MLGSCTAQRGDASFPPECTCLEGRLYSVVAAVFLVLVLVKYPLVVVRPFPSGIEGLGIYLSSAAQLSAFAFFMILLRYRRLVRLFHDVNIFPLSAFTAAFLVVTLQFLTFQNHGLDEFCLSMSWFVIPMAVCLYFTYFRRLVVPFMAFLWAFSMVHTIWQVYIGSQCVGIPANRNWHGAFLICTTPFLLYWLYSMPCLKSKSAKARVLLLAFPSALSLYALWQTDSRGAQLSLAVAAAVFVFLNYTAWLKDGGKLIRKLAPAFIALSVAGTVLFFLLSAGNIAAMIFHDVRIPLWRGAVELFADNMLLGVGASSFEGEYSYHMPVEYFLRSHYFAGRADHPHNQLLFFAGAFGITGLLASSFLALAPIAIFMRRYKSTDALSKLVFFGFVMLLTHSMLDMVAEKWPTAQMLLILQGLMWYYTFRRRVAEAAAKPLPYACPATLKYCCVGVALLFLACSLHMLSLNARASYHARNSAIAKERHQHARAIRHRLESLRISPDGMGLYECAMMSLFWLNDHLLAYKYFTALETSTSRIVVHSNARIAECLIKMNRKRDALAYMELEARVFPLSSLALYNKLLLQMELGEIDDAEITARQLIQVMEFKGLDMKDMRAIIDDPGLDHRFHKLKSTAPPAETRF